MLIALWKPYGYVSRFTDEGAHPGLAGLVQVKDVYPVGRLDHDSEGLLLLSDDGALAHALTDPRYAHPRTYQVQVERRPPTRRRWPRSRAAWWCRAGARAPHRCGC